MPFEPRDTITSRQNPLCKLVRSLHGGKGRAEHGLFVVEGANAVQAALASGWTVEFLLASGGTDASGPVERAKAMGVSVQQVSPEILAYIADAESAPEGIALARIPELSAPDELNGLNVVLDGVADAGNIGTLIRCADAVGASRVFATEGSADPFNPKAVRASAGSIFHLPNMGRLSPAHCAKALAQAGIPIVIAVAHDGVDCFSYKWPHRCALVLGHETRGISTELQEAAAARVTIPMPGNAESLNVAMAGAVLMYAWHQSTR